MFGLVLGALSLGALAVVLDRVNFPQKKFRARSIVTEGQGPTRDRTGAHIVVLSQDDQPESEPPLESPNGPPEP